MSSVHKWQLQPVKDTDKGKPASLSATVVPQDASTQLHNQSTVVSPMGQEAKPSITTATQPDEAVLREACNPFSSSMEIQKHHVLGLKEEQVPKDYRSNQIQPGVNPEMTGGKSTLGIEQSRKVKEDDKTVQESVSTLKIDAEAKPSEAKQGNEVNGNHTFKFALVHYVKELLNPAWKGGQVSKDAYKIIVKKAVDKVIVTIPKDNIPQTAEQIKHYLSTARPNLVKLVKAYVEKEKLHNK